MEMRESLRTRPIPACEYPGTPNPAWWIPSPPERPVHLGPRPRVPHRERPQEDAPGDGERRVRRQPTGLSCGFLCVRVDVRTDDDRRFCAASIAWPQAERGSICVGGAKTLLDVAKSHMRSIAP